MSDWQGYSIWHPEDPSPKQDGYATEKEAVEAAKDWQRTAPFDILLAVRYANDERIICLVYDGNDYWP